MHGHVGDDLLDDLPRGPFVQPEPTGKPVQAPHHVLDRSALVRGFWIVADPSTGEPMMTAVTIIVRSRPDAVTLSAKRVLACG